MKLKIFITPTLLLIIVILCIWLVYPAYSNGSNGLKEKNIQLKEEQAKLKSVQNKDSHVKKLANEISSSVENTDILYKFIPFDTKEEEIEDNLNYLASSSGLSVLSIGIVDNTKKGGDKDLKDDLLTSVNMNVSGNYKALKKFIGSINNLRRYNKIKKLTIKNKILQNRVDETKANEVGVVVLNARMNIDFVSLAKNKLTDKDVNNPIFSAETLSMDAITQIKGTKNTNILPITVEEKGRANLFMPVAQ